MVEVEEGLYRITFSLPLGIDHVHCYLVRSSNGGFILVDTGLGSRDPEARWRPVLDALDAPIEAIVVTHLHPDHVGGARDVAELTGAPVFQGRDDHAQCTRAWGERDRSGSPITGRCTGCRARRSRESSPSRTSSWQPCTGWSAGRCSTRATRSTAGGWRSCAGMPTVTSSSSATAS